MSNAKPFSTLKDYSINDSINWKSRKQCNAFTMNGAPAIASQCFQQRSQKLEEVIQKIKADREIDKYDQPWRFTDSFADSKAPHFLRRNSLLFRIRSIYYREKQISFYNKLENEPQLVQAWRNAINFEFNDHLEELHGYDIEDLPREDDADDQYLEPLGESDMEEYDDEIPSSDESDSEDNVYYVEEPLSSGESDFDNSEPAYFEDQSSYESEDDEYSYGSRFFGFYHQNQNMNYHDHYYSESSAASSRASSVERSHQYDRYSSSYLQIELQPSLTFFQQQLDIELPPSSPTKEIALLRHPNTHASYEKSALIKIATNPNDKNGLLRSFYTNYHYIILNALDNENKSFSMEELAFSEDVEHSISYPPPSGLQFQTYSNKEFNEMRPYMKDLLIAWKKNLSSDVEDEETPLDTWNRLVIESRNEDQINNNINDSFDCDPFEDSFSSDVEDKKTPIDTSNRLAIESQNQSEVQNINNANDPFEDGVVFADSGTSSRIIIDDDTSPIVEATTPATKASQKGRRPRKENSSRAVALPNAKRTGTYEPSPMNLRRRARKEVITGNTSRVVAIPVRSGPPSKKRRGRNGMITENISHDVAPKEVERLRRRRKAVIIENTSPAVDEPPPKKKRGPKIDKEIHQCVKCNTMDTSKWQWSAEYTGKLECKACYTKYWRWQKKNNNVHRDLMA